MEPIIIEETYNKPIEVVWKAITELDQMRKWFFDNIPSFEPYVGFKTQFNVKSVERNFLHQWRLTEVDPPHKITCNWSFEGYPGNALVTFELMEEGGKTRIRLTDIITEVFPDNIEEFKRESGVEGWKYFINGRLKEYLENS